VQWRHVSTEEGEPVRKPLLLVVDDAAGMRDMVAQILRDEGYAVEVTEDRAEALAAVVRSRPNLVLLEMRVPNVNGWKFARALNERKIDIPIIVMTAAQSAKAWAREIGAAGYLSKPFGIQELIDKVQALCPLEALDIADGYDRRQIRTKAS
jgi:DNA-binding response OmpR family regulator